MQRALAAAHTAMGMSHELANDPGRAASDYAAALSAAERAGDALQIARIRNARGALELEARPVRDALEILDEAVRHADTVGFAAFHARALVNRGRAKQGIGRFEEAMADFTAARGIYERIGSPSVALALTREGSMHALRGDGFLARAAFETRDPRGQRRRRQPGARTGADRARPDVALRRPRPGAALWPGRRWSSVATSPR